MKSLNEVNNLTIADFKSLKIVIILSHNVETSLATFSSISQKYAKDKLTPLKKSSIDPNSKSMKVFNEVTNPPFV